MTPIGILGGGAFGTALAVTLARSGVPVALWLRAGAREIAKARQVPRLPGISLLPDITVTDDMARIGNAQIVLAAVPMQSMGTVLAQHRAQLDGKSIVACCKGIDLSTGLGATAVINANLPNARAAILSGPSFAADIARGLPTALTIAARDGAEDLQQALSTPTLRLYRSDDPSGVEIGGALKNVIAIACGGAIGEGMGESARAALMTRGFAEIQRLARPLGANPATLMGLSGLGDLALTCTSELSRNYCFGLALGRQTSFDADTTVEGVATAKAVHALGEKLGLDLPIAAQVARISDGKSSVGEAIQSLLSRPLRAE